MVIPDDELIPYRIADFGISLAYPSHWQQRVEDGGTHLFWDQYTGSLRVTPTFPDGEGFDADPFLERERLRQQALSAEFRRIGEQRFLCYVEDKTHGDEVTRNHLYLTGRGRVLVVCSWAYDLSLLDDELSADEVEGELENAEAVLGSLTYARETS